MKLDELRAEIKSGKFTYPAITIAFIAIGLTFFILTANFISQSVKGALDLDYQSIESRLLRFDQENYLYVARRLGINTEQTNTEQELTPGTPAEAEPKAEEPALVPEDKSFIKISILNSTKTPGLASDLEKELETAGFTVTKTGNQPSTEATTVIRNKQSAGLAFPNSIKQLREIVDRTYEIGTGATIPETEDYDIIVIIGTK